MNPIGPALAQLGAEIGRLTAAFGRRVDVGAMRISDRAGVLPLAEPGRVSPNGAARLIEAADGWIAVNLAREEDQELVPAWLGGDVGAEPWPAIAEAARTRPWRGMIADAALLGIPAAGVGEVVCERLHAPLIRLGPAGARPATPRVVDLSALWAGPMCGAILAAAGCAVTKIESPRRPDPTRQSTPEFFQRLNGRKAELAFDFTTRDGRGRLRETILAADVVITGARPRGLASLGLAVETLMAEKPGLVWVAITGYGWTGPGANRVAFGDDAAAAGGLVGWEGGAPRFLGDALADPVTGLAAAAGALQALEAGGGLLVDAALARSAAAAGALCGLRASA